MFNEHPTFNIQKGIRIAMHHKSGCLLCGKEIVYRKKTTRLKCIYCEKTTTSSTQCINGHFICDRCHSLSAMDIIEKYCNETKMLEPLEMAQFLMRNKVISMHGPEHHYLVPAVLISSFLNARGMPGKKAEALKLARSRAENVPGGSAV